MAKRSKAYLAAAEKVDRDKLYCPLQAAKLAKETSSTKMDATVEVAIRLGVDPRKADQMVRGTVNLPHGTGKTARVIVFAAGEKAAEAEAAGADAVGAEDLIERIQGGWLDFDAAIATPDQMAKVGRIARILGPRGLMPNPKTGTVTPDVTKAVNDIKGGKINFRVDKQANLHFVIGKASFDDAKLVENYGAALDEILRAKPSTAKGRYVKKVTVSTTTGPGIPVDPNRTRNLLEDADAVSHASHQSAGTESRVPAELLFPGQSSSSGSDADIFRQPSITESRACRYAPGHEDRDDDRADHHGARRDERGGVRRPAGPSSSW